MNDLDWHIYGSRPEDFPERLRIDLYKGHAFFHEASKPIIAACLDIIEKSGMNAHDAQYIPYYLSQAIQEHNRVARGESAFKVFPLDEFGELTERPQ